MRPPRMRPELLTWAQQTVGRDARVRAPRRLTGGLTSLVHELTVERNGRRSRYVLRSWPPGNEHEDWILRSIATEAATLTALERSDVPAPRLVASTCDAAAGGPALLMTRVAGRLLLMPRDREHWLRQMAQMLARTSGTRRLLSLLSRARPRPRVSSIATISTSTCCGRASG